MAAITTSAYAQLNSNLRGPDPTVGSLEASAGPYTVATATIPKQTSYGGGVVYYPTKTTDGPFGVVAFAPGFVNTNAANKWWGPELASHGFVVLMIDTLTLFDLPGLRGKELQAALKDVIARSQTKGEAYYGLIDPARRAVMGHSMGGGGTLSAAASDNTLKAAIPLAPWSTVNDWSKVTTPTLIIGGQNDAVAPVSTMSTVFYGSLPATLNKA
ncbi:alpha/beta hydrolase, partial [Aquabacterium sp.]|uniref:alpha/beta hydrolase family protein n=1 Tax=Aquabacterium sp. TaxID=1872578 RepID=UPI0025B930B2